MEDNIKIFNSEKSPDLIEVNNLKVWVDRNLCLGAATCLAVAPKSFIFNLQARAVILSSVTTDNSETIIEAAKACPVTAIFIEDNQDKRIFSK